MEGVTETPICIDEGWKKSMGYRLFLNSIIHKKVTHVNFFAGIFLSYLPEQFVEIQKFYNRGNVT